jgi:hypothetical protein
VNNQKTKQQKPKINLNDLARHLTPLPVQDRIYPDCPHDTAILIVVTYVDDNLAFSNCETMQPTATNAFVSTTKDLPAGTSAHNMTETQSREL